MVYSAAQLVREQGVAATGVRDVVRRADAPRGSFQHYFPGGKDQLVGEAVVWSGRYAADWVRRYRAEARRPSAEGLLAHVVKPWKQELLRRDFQRGCPLMAAAGDLAGGQSPVTDSLRAAATDWEAALRTELSALGVPARSARSLASLILSALEGAIMLARVHRDVAPLTTVVRELTPLLAAHR